ncbi:ATP-binding protein [Maribacter chungangensis]|uniref:histidine kinase n=1 Tax=Maribacter chungangensis TaxID=1069117 RepID=A0ABW3B4Q5_9FLAO
MGNLLEQQIREHIPKALQDSPDIRSFIDVVANTYANYDERLSKMQQAGAKDLEEPQLDYDELLRESERQKQVEVSLKKAVDSLNVNLGVTDKLEDNQSLNIGTEKLARHVNMLASQMVSVTEEKNVLLNDLEAQNEALNTYIKMVSHDLKSPIRNINALMSWILEEEKSKFSEDSRRHCSLVSDNLLRMDNLINGILQHATVGNHMGAQSKLDVAQLVLEVANNCEIPSNIALKFDEELPVISIQKYWIEQVFSNLIANAITATQHKESGIISIGYIADEAYWKFIVKDNGKGIPQKHLTSIFDMFTKLENGTNAAGVGLSLVKKITSLYNGDVWLESEVGKGTTFYVTFKKE